MVLTLTALASARLRIWLHCAWCGRRVVLDAAPLARAHGERSLQDSVHRMRCGHCGRQEAQLVMLTGPQMPGDPRMHSPHWDAQGPLYVIDCWPPGAPYCTIIAGPFLDGVQAAWAVSEGYEPHTELTLRQGARVLATRERT